MAEPSYRQGDSGWWIYTGHCLKCHSDAQHEVRYLDTRHDRAVYRCLRCGHQEPFVVKRNLWDYLMESDAGCLDG